ncbi:hypothetical protein K9N68_16470 [Kovacikia minuta CCNUW1]|uniref:hypothetical protein n=1 Tax=Kovacikia minuta TaxID=2931930 RepID=UPI001CCFD650|nr:hypothetical protein [Kovacikia minuta]UBF29281.1 hypothetical protein K9N68_16470 [Kovacikia minuta CCNUW1]
MKPRMIRNLLSGGLIVVSLIAGSRFVAPLAAQTPPAQTYQRGAFQPVARVNPKLPIRVQLINRTSEAVDYIVVTYTNSRRLAPGQTTQLSNFPLPAYFNINPNRDRIAIQYSVSVDQKNNTAIVEIFPSGLRGDHSLNIDQTGAIYIY